MLSVERHLRGFIVFACFNINSYSLLRKQIGYFWLRRVTGCALAV